MTSGLTFLTVLSLLILGGPVLRGFAFVMTVGIIVGTYSSIYVASPFALLWENLFGAQGRWRKDKGAPVRGADGQLRAESRIDRTAGPADSRNRPSPGGSSTRPARRRV